MTIDTNREREEPAVLRSGSCICANDLRKFLRMSLSEKASDTNQHVDQCNRCRSLLAEAAELENGSVVKGDVDAR